MKRSSILGISLLLSCVILMLTSALRSAQASDLSYARIVRVSLVSGDVQLSRPGHSAWEAATQNMPVTQGATIGTNNGYAEIEFEDGTIAWISRDTLVQFTELALADGGRITKLTLAQGTMSVLTSLRRGDSFTMATSGETLTVPKNSFFRVDCFHDGASVSVLSGSIEAASTNGTKTVAKGQTLAYQTKLANVSLGSNPKADNWDRWVVTRAQVSEAEAAQSSSYVDAPFSYGLADMSSYGAWNYFAGYGYGWQPTGVGSCWTPFADGQWSFYSGLGWTWVSAEPWGWMPYHFGSWNFIPSYGWTWFPSEFGFWDPAPVDWYSAGNQVGWWPATLSGSSPLMFDQIASGCSGFGGTPFGTVGNSRMARREAIHPLRRPVRPGAPMRLILTTDRLGHNSIHLSAFGGDAQRMPIRSTEPFENGKPSGIAFSANAGNARVASRVLVTTAPDMAHLQRSLGSAGGRMPMMKLNAAPLGTPSHEALRAVNAMPSMAMPSHRPSPAFHPSFSNAATRGYSSQGFGSTNGPAVSVRAASVPSNSSSHASSSAASTGKPH